MLSGVVTPSGISVVTLILRISCAAARLADKTTAAQLDALQAYTAKRDNPVLPYSDELAKRVLELALATPGHTGTRAWWFVRMLGPNAAPLLNALLAEDPTLPRSVALLDVLAGWASAGLRFEPPDLLPFLSEPGEYLTRRALDIARMGLPFEPKLAARLMEMFRDSPAADFARASTGLARMGPKGTALLLEHALSEEDAVGRIQAMQSLGYASPEGLRPHLQRLSEVIADPEAMPGLRAAAIYALVAMRGDCVECLPAIREALRDESYEYVSTAIGVLTLMGDKAAPAVPDLLRFLAIDDPKVGDPTARLLGTIGARADLVVPALDRMVRDFASDEGARALATFGPRALPVAMKILQEGDEYAQYAALWTFAHLGEQAASAVPTLIALIDGEDEDIAARAIGTLGYIGPKASAAVPKIMALTLAGEDTLSAQAAAGALVRMGEPAHDALLNALRSSEKQDQRRALRVLTHFHLHNGFALDDLERFTKEKDIRMRAHAYAAIAASVIDPRESYVPKGAALDHPTLKRVLAILEQGKQDKEQEVRSQAERYLPQIQSFLTEDPAR